MSLRSTCGSNQARATQFHNDREMDSNPKRPLLQRPFSNHINMRYKWWWTLQGSFRTSLCLEEVHVRSAGPNRAASQPPRSCLPGAWKGMEETLTVTRRGDPPRTRSDPGSSYPASRLTARTGRRRSSTPDGTPSRRAGILAARHLRTGTSPPPSVTHVGPRSTIRTAIAPELRKLPAADQGQGTLCRVRSQRGLSLACLSP